MLTDAHEIINFIRDAKKQTPVKLYVNGDLSDINIENAHVFGSANSKLIIADITIIDQFLQDYKEVISDYYLEYDRRNSAVPLLDISHINARIEPGALIREHVTLGNNAVIMMGAVINIGAVIGEGTMIDMNAVIGGRGIIGQHAHIGAGAVIAGVIEPPTNEPVRIGDRVLIGANAVILEGVQIGDGAVVAAGSVVTCDVAENTVVAGIPAKFIKIKDQSTEQKTQIIDALRKLT